MIVQKPIPENILQDSVLAHIAAAYFSVAKKLERKTRCSATRGFILSTLRDGTELNQNQIATQLGFDRTVVHRSIQTMVHDGLVARKKGKSGRAILIRLTAKGQRYREFLIQQRRLADAKLSAEMSPQERSTLARLLKLIAELDL
ncbi:MAG TPA: GntR family transcriptional regulator [Terriglobales bacterium]|jgi:DNA-binding MarR family transcriptional regulator|nr:GntR family transcriptional regulator [Terriglobales bacterium]